MPAVAVFVGSVPATGADAGIRSGHVPQRTFQYPVSILQRKGHARYKRHMGFEGPVVL